MGYLGAATGDVVTGYYSVPEHGGWQVAIYVWAGWAFAGAAIMAILWNTTAQKIGVLPGIVPKLFGTAMLTAAGAAVSYGGQADVLQWATFSAAVVMLAAFRIRWASAPAFLVAAAGLMMVFASYVQSTSGQLWDERAAMVAYGLAMIAAVMVFVEHKGEACELS